MLPYDTCVTENVAVAHCWQSDVPAIRRLIDVGIEPDLLPTLLDPDEVTRVSVGRIHFSDKRPPNLHLDVHQISGQCDFLHAEYVGAEVKEYARREQEKLYKSRRGQLQKQDRSSFVALPDQGLVVRRPGLDSRLPGLRLLYCPDETIALLTQFNVVECAPISMKLVAHRLGKRAVIRIDSASTGTLYARLRVGRSNAAYNAYLTHQKLNRRLAYQNQLLLPTPLGFDRELAVAVYRTLPGHQFNPAHVSAAEQCVDIARAIKVLQSLQNISLPEHTGRDEQALLQRFYSRTVSAFPDIAARLVDPLERIGKALIDESSCERVVCHRDLHPQQVFLHEQAVGMLDFDTACLSNPALDVGNLAAHLFLAEARGECRARVLEASLIEGLGGVQRSQFDLWRASALLRLAMLYCFSAEPQTVITALIDEVSQCCCI